MLAALGVAGLAAIGAPGHAQGRGASGKSEAVFESVYNYLIMTREGDVARFRRMENGATVSAVDLANPRRQVITYTGALFAGAFVKPKPKRVLNVGLGAGAINRLFDWAYPDTQLTTVEIDPMMLKVATTYTAFQQSKNDKVVLEDGRRYVARSSDRWDWIILDAFVRNSQVPFHLTTVEFYRLLADHMSADGVLVTNLHPSTLLYLSHLRTLRKAFPQVVLIQPPNSGNMIAMAVKFATPNLMQMIAATKTESLPALLEWGVDFAAMKKSAYDTAAVKLPAAAPLLSDDFAPVEFLDLQKQ